MDRLAFEAALRRDGYQVVNSGLKPDTDNPDHAHDFDVRVMVLGGAITITRDGTPQTFRAGDTCEFPAGTIHAEHVGPEGVAYLVGRRAPAA
jgi:quercetin dioxygenase-like cupin family protein